MVFWDPSIGTETLRPMIHADMAQTPMLLLDLQEHMSKNLGKDILVKPTCLQLPKLGVPLSRHSCYLLRN